MIWERFRKLNHSWEDWKLVENDTVRDSYLHDIIHEEAVKSVIIQYNDESAVEYKRSM